MFVDGLETGGRTDDHLDRQSTGTAGQRRQVERERINALDLAELALDQRLERDRRALSLIPRLQQHAGDSILRAIDAVENEAQVGLGKAAKDLVELLAVIVRIIDVGVFRRLGHGKHNALVFFGREFF